jgi:hypothetical protein
MFLEMNSPWINFIFFLLASVGMTKIVVEGSIFEPVRTWLSQGGCGLIGSLRRFLSRLVECHLCTGMWSGMFMCFLLVSYKPNVVFACGCVGALASVVSTYLLTYIEARTIVDLPPMPESENNGK